MADRKYILFDSIDTGTSVFDTLLFQVASGADAVHSETYTNMRGAGSLPGAEKFTLNKISVIVPPSLTPNDTAALFKDSILQFRLLNQVLLWIPLIVAVDYSLHNGFFTLATAANNQVYGNLGEGYTVDPPIDIAGGEKFDVRVKTGNATSFTYRLVIALVGILTF
jgi:hypothetical protein